MKIASALNVGETTRSPGCCAKWRAGAPRNARGRGSLRQMAHLLSHPVSASHAYQRRARTLSTERADHMPPRGVAISRRLSSAAIALALVTPSARMPAMVDARPFALSAAAALLSFQPL